MASVAPPTTRIPRPVTSADVARRTLAGLQAGVYSPTLLLTLGLAVIAGSVILRTAAIDAHYWVDEGISLGIASHPLAQIPGLLGQDGSPPLYYLVLHVWMALFGQGEVATHALSLAFAILAIPATLWAGWSLFGRWAGVAAAGLVAFEPFLSYYAQETRMYSLLALLSIVAGAAFVHAFAFGRRRYSPLFVVADAVALYTHNWALFATAAAGVAFLFCLARSNDRRRTLVDGVLAFGAVAVLYAPWVPTLLFQAAHTGAPWSGRPTAHNLAQGLYIMGGGRKTAKALALAAAAGLAWTLGCRHADRPLRWSRSACSSRRGVATAAERAPATALVALAILGMGTLLIAWNYARVSQPDWADRYLAILIGPLALLVGAGLGRLRVAGLAVIAVAVGLWVAYPHLDLIRQKSDVHAVSAAIGPQLSPGDLVVSTQPEQIPVLRHYLPRGLRYATPSGMVPDVGVVDWRNALARLRAATPRRGLEPLLAHVPVGGRVVLVRPIVGGQPAGAWEQAMLRVSKLWTAALSIDRRFVRVREAGGPTGTAVRAFVYLRVPSGIPSQLQRVSGAGPPLAVHAD